jgi:hypothetical protein
VDHGVAGECRGALASECGQRLRLPSGNPPR